MHNPVFLQATEDLENMEEAEKHMTKGMAQFETVEKAGDEGDYAIVSDMYLEPLRLQFHEPDWSKLERKPEKPPVPQVLSSRPIRSNLVFECRFLQLWYQLPDTPNLFCSHHR